MRDTVTEDRSRGPLFLIRKTIEFRKVSDEDYSFAVVSLSATGKSERDAV